MAANQKKSRQREKKKQTQPSAAPTGKPTLNRVIFALALFGMLVTVHLWIQAERGFSRGCLGLSDPAEVGIVECSAVVQSDAGTFLGVSNIAWGFLFFGVVAVLAFTALIVSDKRKRSIRNWAFYLVSAGLLYALYLFIYQVFQLNQFCVLCLTTATVTLILFILHFVEFRSKPMPRLDVHGTVREIGLYCLMAVIAGMLLVADIFFVNKIGTDAIAGATVEAVDVSSDSVYAEETGLAELPPVDLGVCEFDASIPPIEDLDGLLAGTPFFGEEEAPVRIVTFFDPNCPHCKTLHDRMDSIQEAVGNKARFFYKPYPVFPYSMTQVEGIYVAARHGRFYEMIDKQLERQERGGLNIDEVVRLAGEVGVDVGAFRADMNSGRVRRLVNRDRILIRDSGLRSVPKLTIEGNFVSGASLRPACIASLVEQVGA